VTAKQTGEEVKRILGNTIKVPQNKVINVDAGRESKSGKKGDSRKGEKVVKGRRGSSTLAEGGFIAKEQLPNYQEKDLKKTASVRDERWERAGG